MNNKNVENNILINEIVELEYEMFDKVIGINGREPCQNDYKTFYIMRYSQHKVFSKQTLESYKDDLIKAKIENRNLVTEKYGYMMEISDNDYYERVLKNRLPLCTKEKIDLINNIMFILNRENDKFKKNHSKTYEKLRFNNQEKVITMEDYIFGELKTYSKRTLENWISDIVYLIIKGENIFETIQKQIINFYNFEDLDKTIIKII